MGASLFSQTHLNYSNLSTGQTLTFNVASKSVSLYVAIFTGNPVNFTVKANGSTGTALTKESTGVSQFCTLYRLDGLNTISSVYTLPSATAYWSVQAYAVSGADTSNSLDTITTATSGSISMTQIGEFVIVAQTATLTGTIPGCNFGTQDSSGSNLDPGSNSYSFNCVHAIIPATSQSLSYSGVTASITAAYKYGLQNPTGLYRSSSVERAAIW